MPQKKYDLTSYKGKLEKDFNSEADRKKRLDEIVKIFGMQQTAKFIHTLKRTIV